MTKKKFLHILPLILEYGFLTYGVLYKGWSPMFILFGLWVEGFVRPLCTNILVLLSKGSGKIKFILGHTFVSLVFQFGQLIFLFIVVGAAFKAGKDPFIENFLSIFFGHQTPEEQPIIQVYLEKNQLVSPEIFRKDILQLFWVICLGYFIPMISEIFELRRNNQEWKKGHLSAVSLVKVHALLIAFGILSIVVGNMNRLGLVFIGVSLLIDILMRKGGFQTIEQFMNRKSQKKNKNDMSSPIIEN